MPLAKIHVVEGRYDAARIAKVSGAIRAALMNTLRVPPDDFYQLIFELAQCGERILHGTKPSELPVQGPVKFELVINQKIAKTMDFAANTVFTRTRPITLS